MTSTPTGCHGLKQLTLPRTDHSGGCWRPVPLHSHSGASRRWWCGWWRWWRQLLFKLTTSIVPSGKTLISRSTTANMHHMNYTFNDDTDIYDNVIYKLQCQICHSYWSKGWRWWWQLDYWSTGCPSCHPTNSVKALKGKISHSMNLLTPSSPGGLPTLSLTTNSSWLPWGRVSMPLISPLMPVPHSPSRVMIWLDLCTASILLHLLLVYIAQQNTMTYVAIDWISACEYNAIRHIFQLLVNTFINP